MIFASLAAQADEGLAQPTPDPRPFARDVPEHDPNITPPLTLRSEINQNTYAAVQAWKVVEFGLGGWLATTANRLLIHPYPSYHHVITHDPDRFSLLNLHPESHSPHSENGPSFVNADFDFKNISDRKQGFCWGIATIIRNFSILAFFEPQDPKNPDINFYKNIIDQIAAGKPMKIPGYSNFREFSLVPELELYLKLTSMNIWRVDAIRFQSLFQYIESGKKMTKNKVDEILTQLEEKLARHEMPKLLMTSSQLKKSILKVSEYNHVVLPYRIERNNDGSAKIWIWDVDFFAETLEREPKWIEISADGVMKYAPWIEPASSNPEESTHLSHLFFTPENDRETAIMIHELDAFL